MNSHYINVKFNEENDITQVKTEEEWKSARKEREGLPWYKNPGLKGQTNRF